jgi:hypothetical protein
MLPSQGSVPARRPNVIAALRRHGLSTQAAASLWTIARVLARDSRRRGREYSAMVDAESGVQVGPTLSGQAHQIDIRPQLLACQAGRDYGHLHTHPSSGGFSDADVRVLLSNRALRTVVVIALDGRWYAMSRSGEIGTADPWTANDRFAIHFRRLVDDPTMPVAEIPHVVWSSIAVSLGLRYDRIEGRTR